MSSQPTRDGSRPHGSSRSDLEKLAARLTDNQAEARQLLKTVETTQKNAREAFHRWRREHTVFLVSSGVILGAGIFGTALYLYLDRYPSAIEFFVVEKTVRAFDRSLSFENRKKVYMSLPEPSFPNFESSFLQAIDDALESKGSGQSLSSDDILNGWADLVEGAINKAEAAWILAAKKLMRKRLTEEISNLESLESRIDNLSEIYPSSVERNLVISNNIDEFLEKGNFVAGSLLEKVRPQSPERSCDILTQILIHAIAFFPGPINKLIHFLDEPAPESENGIWRVVGSIVADLNQAVASHDEAQQNPVMTEVEDPDTESIKKVRKPTVVRRMSSRRLLESTGLVRTALEKTLKRMKRLFDELPKAAQNYVLTEALLTTITNLPHMPRVGGVRPYDLYVRAIEDDLIGPLRRDARITEDILKEVKHIFLAMPADLQTRVLLTALRHPLAQIPLDEASPEAQAELVRDLLSSGGVVAVKLAQMLAEHPKMPSDYQLLLGSLRDENEPMPTAQFWRQIPSSVRSTILELGKCLGTGSVKQANIARFQNERQDEYAVVVLRARVEDEALSSISALETSDELGPVATRLGRLVYGEFNLHLEGEVLEEFAATRIGQHPLFHVVKVRHHSPKCLVEEIARGQSVATFLEKVANTDEVKAEKNRVFEILMEYHRTIMRAFINDGVIHSDVHLGNANYLKEEDGSDGFVLFDVGQFDRIGLPDTKALLWTLAAMSTIENRVAIRNVAVAHLVSTSSLKDKSIKEKEQRAVLRKRLDEAFGEAITANEAGEFPDKRTAYMLFLRAAEKRGVNVPKGAFSVAKMIDGIVSQQERYDLPTVVDDEIEAFLRKHMTWGELADIGARQIRII